MVLLSRQNSVKIIKTENGYNGRGGLVGKICWVKCNWCDKIIRIGYFRAKSGRGKFCSKSCYGYYLATLSMNKSLHWKGGRTTSLGYKFIRQKNGRYKREHILKIEKKLGRELRQGEVIHHINGVRNDNRLSNLKLMKNIEHLHFHLKLKREKLV